MHATNTTRRFAPINIKQAAMVVGIAASLAAATLAATLVRDDAGAGSGSVSARIAPPSYEFLEQNLALPTGSLPVTGSDAAAYLFREQNLELPTGSVVAPPTIDYRFLEDNLYLPVSVAGAPDWRVLEENRWGEDFFASPVDIHPQLAETSR
jgi:hypothetical protein